MPFIKFDRDDLPLWSSGTGTIQVQLENPLAPLTPANSELLGVSFGATGGEQWKFGSSGTTQLGVSASTKATLRALWPPDFDSDLLKQYKLSPGPGEALLALQLGASGGASASGSLTFSRLGAGASLNTGADASYTFIRTLSGAALRQPSQSVLTAMFKALRLPGDAMELLAAGDLLAFEYGGYLQVGGKLTAGYEIQGSPRVQVGQLNLSERFSVSVLGSLNVAASIAGRFAVEMRSAPAPTGLQGEWVRVVVRRSRNRSLGVAADVSVQAANSLDGLPQSSDEFLGALLGVSTSSWFNYLTAAAKVRTFEQLEQMTDTLSWHYLSQLTDKGFDAIKDELDSTLAVLKDVTAAYNQFDSRAITLLDRYYDKVETTLQPALTKVGQISDWRSLLAGAIPDDLRNVIAILSDGDPRFPLSWIANLSPSAQAGDEGVGELQKRANALLDALRAGLHKQVAAAIRLGKEKFGLNPLFAQLEGVASSEKLKQVANQAVGGFASRLVGDALTALRHDSDFQKIAKRITKALDSRAQFQDRLYQKFVEAANNDYGLRLRAEYQSASQDTALVDALVNVSTEIGKRALMGVSDGEFDRLFATYDPGSIRINDGLLTSSSTRKRTFKVNVFGWHDKFNYERTGLDQLIVSADQHIKTETDGSLSIFTQFSLSEEKVRRTGLRKSEESIRTNLLLQFLGQSRGVVTFDDATHRFLLDAINVSGARYTISLNDTDTDPQELSLALRFAEELGILGSTLPSEIARALPMQNNSYGQVEADYDVRFSPEGLNALFSREVTESQLRTMMRKIVLINYVASRNSSLTAIAWAYWTAPVYDLWNSGQSAFTNHSSLEFRPISAAPFLSGPAPSTVLLQRSQLQNLSTLYFIEDGFIAALETLREVLQPVDSSDKLSPAEFAKRLEGFGKALSKFDDFDEGVNTIFALFDQIIRLSLPTSAHRDATLTLTAKLAGNSVTQVYGSLASPRVLAAAGSNG